MIAERSVQVLELFVDMQITINTEGEVSKVFFFFFFTFK